MDGHKCLPPFIFKTAEIPCKYSTLHCPIQSLQVSIKLQMSFFMSLIVPSNVASSVLTYTSSRFIMHITHEKQYNYSPTKYNYGLLSSTNYA